MRWARGGRVVVVGVVAGLASAGCQARTPKPRTGEGGGAPSPPPPSASVRAKFDLLAFGRVLGTVAPCGCTTEPLGGLQYAFGYIGEEVAPAASLVLEPGSFLFPDPGGALWPTDEASWKQADDRAAMLHARFAGLGDRLVSGVGPTDVASPHGAQALASWSLPRVVANVEGLGPGHRVTTLRSGGLAWKVGVTAVVDPTLAGATALGDVTPVSAALQQEVAAMRGEGASLTVVLAHGDREFADAIASEVDGIDLVVVGVPRGIDAERIGSAPRRVREAYVLEPGTQLQTLTRLSLSVDGTATTVPPLDAWTISPGRAALESELSRVDERLQKFRADPDADPRFVARLEQERTRVQEALSGAPSGAAVATLEQVKVTCKLPIDQPAKQALLAYDQGVAAANEQRFTGVHPPAPAPGRPGYVGMQACEGCHDEAISFWKTTVHAGAYETLQEGGKEFDLTCVGCHVTGFRRPGGSEVVENAGLRDVQCESCHGPASLHVADGGGDLGLIRLDVPAEHCASECHTPEHSDTFVYDAYLRDILGPGHGVARRAELGEGPTGHELRQVGLAKAGGSCKEKMM